ncbi:hypothetical protein BDV98DRAFT_318181 [Pterulicium gracile]|uniref:GRIP domain-containing protein n=1 Tax=Pterulicium gracile TaxID=1884261 RepID=A0A5C3QRH5_9AGAR|nr:hypothetical protein BDV98DRAFT_318181 [Pterula gracilis]
MASSPPVNGHVVTNKDVDNGLVDDTESQEADSVESLRKQLKEMREEKASLQTQHANLLTKVQAMRTTLGEKLKQDAEELDRQEQLIQQLTAQNDDLESTVDTLKEELMGSVAEAERAAKELDTLRSRAFHDNTQESLARERELRETQSELERCRMDSDEWERAAMQEKVAAEEARLLAEELRRDLEVEREARLREASQLDSEREKASNLQSVLEDFQSAKDHELKQALKAHDTQLVQITQSLAEFKHRAHTAELRLEETQSNTSKTDVLEKEVKEKNLLIGKLRHEAVMINEHLIEALRRLRKNSSESNVDRRLVTNVLLSFITTPRADPKRFEMLQLLSSILSWTDAEREKAGLQRMGTAGAPQQNSGGSAFWSRSISGSGSQPAELDKADETESFSRLWVEFLLTEATSGSEGPSSPSRSPSNASLPSSPGTKAGPGRRLPSFSGVSSTSSTPNLALQSPTNKGKAPLPS